MDDITKFLNKFYKYYSCGKDVYVLKNNGRRN
nr:MAG TPA: hypothetical protein [Caudoviricetes sp.]